MWDDFNPDICTGKHHGPVLYVDGDFEVMRCSFCEKLIRNPVIIPDAPKTRKPSSKSCIQICDWTTEDCIVKCNSCGYTGPTPLVEPSAKAPL